MVAAVAAIVVLLLIVGVMGVLLARDDGAPSAAPVSSPAPAAPSPTGSASSAADRRVCVDFDARGGALYSVFVVPMMTGSSGRTSIDVDIAQMRRATSSVALIGGADLAQASGEIADEGHRLVAAADAMGLYDHAEGTALLTSFVGLAVACQKAGHKPSWFDAEKLASI